MRRFYQETRNIFHPVMGHPLVMGDSFSLVGFDILVILGGKNCPILFKVNFQIVLTLVYNPANF